MSITKEQIVLALIPQIYAKHASDRATNIKDNQLTGANLQRAQAQRAMEEALLIAEFMMQKLDTK
jgi:hypothetical protein